MVTLQFHVSTILGKSAKTAQDEIIKLFDSTFEAFTDELRKRQEEINNLKKTLEAAELVSQLTSVNSDSTYLCGKCGVKLNSVILLGENPETTETDKKPTQDLQLNLNDQPIGYEPIEEDYELSESEGPLELPDNLSELSEETTDSMQTTINEEFTQKEESIPQVTPQKRGRGRPRKHQTETVYNSPEGNRRKPKKAEVSITLKHSKTIPATNRQKIRQKRRKKRTHKLQAVQQSQPQTSANSSSEDESQTTPNIELETNTGSSNNLLEPILITCASFEDRKGEESKVPPAVVDRYLEQIQGDKSTIITQTTHRKKFIKKEESASLVTPQKRGRGRPRKCPTEPDYNIQKGRRGRPRKTVVSINLKHSKTFPAKEQQMRGQILKKRRARKLQALQLSQPQTLIHYSISEDKLQTTSVVKSEPNMNRSPNDVLEPVLISYSEAKTKSSISVNASIKEESAPLMTPQKRGRGRPRKLLTEPIYNGQEGNRRGPRKAEVSVTLNCSKTSSTKKQQWRGRILKRKRGRRVQAVQHSQPETTSMLEPKKNNYRSSEDLLEPMVIHFAPFKESDEEELIGPEMPPETSGCVNSKGSLQTTLKEEFTHKENTLQVTPEKRGRGRPSKRKSEPVRNNLKRGRGRPRKEEMTFTFKKFKTFSAQQRLRRGYILNMGNENKLQAMQQTRSSLCHSRSEDVSQTTSKVKSQVNKTESSRDREPLIIPFGEALYGPDSLKMEPEDRLVSDGQCSPQTLVEKHTRQLTKVWLTCPQCPRKFPNKLKLRAHSKFHLKKSEIKCSICGMTFIGKTQMENHEKVHTGERPYCCNICPGRFPNMSQFKKHMLKHTAPDFACEVCGLRASHVSNDAFRKVHLRTKEPCSNCALIYT